MKKTIPIAIYVVHFLVCIILSFDWSFLEGLYMGFGFTFLIIWGLTLPLVTAIIAVSEMIIKTKRKNVNIIEIISGIIGCLIILIYLCSACGLLKHISLNGVYISCFAGTFVIWGGWIFNKIKAWRKQK